MAKIEKSFTVQNVEVQIIGEQLVFEKNGQKVELQRTLGKADYRLVYEFLKKKTDAVKGSGSYSVGNFSYTVSSVLDSKTQDVTVTSRTGIEIGSFTLEQDLADVKYPHQFVRNLVINYLLNTLE